MTKIPPDIPTILCLEGPWENNEGTKTSVKPLLTLYQGASGTNFRYRYCETGGELRKHLQRRPNHHVPVLYLAFHGWNGTIQVGHDVVELEQLAEWMGPDHYQNSSVHFSACHTLLAKQDARDFVAYTDVAWLTGYRKTVDWVESAAADLLVLDLYSRKPQNAKSVRLDQMDAFVKHHDSFLDRLGFAYFSDHPSEGPS